SVRPRLPPTQHLLLASLNPLHRGVGREHHTTYGRARRRIQASRCRLLSALLVFPDHWLEQLLEAIGVQPQESLIRGYEPLVPHVVGHHPLGERRPLADPRLEEPQFPALDRELDVAHVAVMLLQAV